MDLINGIWLQLQFHVRNWFTLWDFVNIVLPIIVPFVGMFIVMCMKTSDTRHHENARFVVTIKDGQLGYIAVVMDLAMVYDLAGKTMTSTAVMACLTGAGAVALGTLVAAHGAVYTTSTDTTGLSAWKTFRHYQVMWLSIAVTVAASMVFHHSHHYLVESSPLAGKPGKHHVS
jgi:hypothetical protein